MKNSRKRICICIAIVTIYIIVMAGKGIYWYYKLEGQNVPIIISTQYSPVSTDIEVYIDEKPVFKDDSLQLLYTFKNIHLTCGIHKLKVVVDQEEFIKYFLVLPVKFIYIEIQKDDSPNYKDDINWFSIEFSSNPIGLM